MKSETCFSTTGNPLTVYDTEEKAQESADHEKTARGSNLTPYQCKKCGLFHLAPQESKVNILNKRCGCTDSNGNFKELYATEEDASKVIDSRIKKGAGQLYVYKCEFSNGYHITHKNFE